MIGYTFRIDPVIQLTETDPLRRIVRVAAHNIVAGMKGQQAEPEVDLDGL